MNKLFLCAAILFSLIGCRVAEKSASAPEKVVVAYVTSWSEPLPDPSLVTHVNYAFGGVNETFDGVQISNEPRFRQIADLKKEAGELKVLLSIGGWGSGRFSEMAANDSLRESFARDCARIVNDYGIDGIDIDWEYPGSSAAGISSSEADKENYTLLMKDIRSQIGEDKLLTLASAAWADFIDFRAIMPYVDFVNIMSYDMGYAPLHQAALYKSENTPDMTCDFAVKAHLAAGVPAGKLVMGLPFYGRGTTGDGGKSYRNIEVPENHSVVWDSVAMVPFIADSTGTKIFCFDNPESLLAKCKYIDENGLLGAMYWEYSGDNDRKELASTVFNAISDQKVKPRVLVLNEGGGQHGPFTEVAMEWLRNEAAQKGFTVTELRNANPVTKEYLKDYQLVIQLDFPPYTWPDEAQEAFMDYIDNGKGGWIGFHHATLLGEFDGYPMWNWFSDFMGGIRFQNYIAALADGTVGVEDATHPVMAGVDSTFVLPDDEWYTYDKSPRENVRVLASVDESTYTPMSEVKMGDHPVIWTNPDKKAKNVYFQFGHSPKLFGNDDFKRLFSNAIGWCLQD